MGLSQPSVFFGTAHCSVSNFAARKTPPAVGEALTAKGYGADLAE